MLQDFTDITRLATFPLIAMIISIRKARAKWGGGQGKGKEEGFINC